jgi:amino acid permease
MKTLQVLTVLAASAVLSTGAFAGSNNNGGGAVTISGPLVSILSTTATARAHSASFAHGAGTVTQADVTQVTPTLAYGAVQASATGAFGASVKGQAASALKTDQLIIAGY